MRFYVFGFCAPTLVPLSAKRVYCFLLVTQQPTNLVVLSLSFRVVGGYWQAVFWFALLAGPPAVNASLLWALQAAFLGGKVAGTPQENFRTDG